MSKVSDMCKHEYLKYGEPQGFNVCIGMKSGECDPRSHGAVNVHARCRLCGHETRFNINGEFHEPVRAGETIVGWAD